MKLSLQNLRFLRVKSEHQSWSEDMWQLKSRPALLNNCFMVDMLNGGYPSFKTFARGVSAFEVELPPHQEDERLEMMKTKTVGFDQR